MTSASSSSAESTADQTATPPLAAPAGGWVPAFKSSAQRRISVRGRTSGHQPTRYEWMAALAVTTGCALVVLATSTDLWFFSDAWPTLAERPLRTLDGWVRPHGGHWLIPAVVLTRGTHAIVGMDYYPWFFLPRVILYAALALAWWRVLRWRGVSAPMAMAVLILFSWLGQSAWMVTVVYIGPIVVNLCALAAAILLDADGQSRRRSVALGAVLVIAAMSSASGPALLSAAGVVAFFGKRRLFLPPIGFAVAIYVTWYLAFVRNDPSPLTPSTPGFGDLVRAPLGMIDLIGAGLAGSVGLAQGWALPSFVLFVAATLLAWRLDRLTRFDAVLLLTGLAIASLGVIVRGGQGISVNAPNRLYLMSMYLLFGLAPPLLGAIVWQTSSRAVRILAPTLVLLLAGVNLAVLIDQIDQRELYRAEDRKQVETAAALIYAGESYVPWTGPSPQAHHKNLAVLVDKGWTGRLHPSHLDDVLATMKMAVAPLDYTQGEPLVRTAGASPDVADDGCMTLITAASLDGPAGRFTVNGAGTVLIQQGTTGDEIKATWEENGHRVGRTLELPAATSVLAYAAPGEPGNVQLTVESPEGSNLQLCGLAAAPSQSNS